MPAPLPSPPTSNLHTFSSPAPLFFLGLPASPSEPPAPILPSHQGHLKGHTLYRIGPWVTEEHSGARAASVSSQNHAPSRSASSSLPPPSNFLLWVQDTGLRTNSPRSPVSSSCCPQGLPPSLCPGHGAPQCLLDSPCSLLSLCRCLFGSPQLTQFEGAISCQGLTNEHPVPKQPGIKWALPNHLLPQADHTISPSRPRATSVSALE